MTVKLLAARMHLRIGALLIVILLSADLRATEGMYIPALLESIEDDMRLMGLKLSAEDIYSVNQSSLKDAIAQFGGGCTSELISSQGLLLTNHHCGFSQIQSHSSVENNLLKDGFWAATFQDELPNPGLTATFIVRMEDVTEALMEGIEEDMAPSRRKEQFEANSKALTEAAIAGTNHEAFIRPFNYGNSYFMIVTKTYTDVRLVGAPPSAIGKHGGDTDNWMWPRHTGDFSLFRIYADENNEPAEYSESNRPYEPAKHLHISLDGVEEGDFTMVYGFPGRTQQYITAEAVDYIVNESNPMRIEFRETSLGVIDAAMRSSEEIAIQYAAKQSRISNAYKKWIGQNKGLIELNALEKKWELQRGYRKMTEIHQKPHYTHAIDTLASLEKQITDYRKAREVFIEYYFYGPEVYSFAKNFEPLIEDYEQLEKDGKLDETIAKMRDLTSAHFKNYHLPTDKEVYANLTKLYLDYMPVELTPEIFVEYASKNDWNGMQMADNLYNATAFARLEDVNELLEKPSARAFAKLKKDPAYVIANAMYDGYLRLVRPTYESLQQEIDANMKVYMQGLMEIFRDRNYWPDANSTLRLTYGKVEGSSPVDGMAYKYYTTAEGILQKYRTGLDDYDLPDRLLMLLENKVYGQYAHPTGELRVCFTGSNHTTGGNSGSPALNANGHLVGLNFDRSWESTMSDIYFAPERCRNIMVDIRYVLWVIDVYAEADRLIEEMTLVRGVGQEQPEREPVQELMPAEKG